MSPTQKELLLQTKVNNNLEEGQQVDINSGGDGPLKNSNWWVAVE